MLTFTSLAEEKASSLLRDAIDEFEIGHFDRVLEMLPEENLLGCTDQELVSAYRMLTLCCIQTDDSHNAYIYASKLLQIDPYYTAYDEAPRFIDLLERIKAGKSAMIITASQQAETMEEAPVPVTLITEEMLLNVGARTLKDALLAYVPGMTDVASNEESNIAMRGVYSSSQEKILFMLNGHRMNSYVTNAYSPDYGMSLEKVKQIEVLRGPASSIYGGVALTAVVNVITKDGQDIEGMQVKGSAGNHGQWQGDLLYGMHYLDLDLTAWANIFTCDGEKHYMPASEQKYGTPLLMGVKHDANIYIDRYDKNPSYDLGANIKWKGVELLFANTYSKRAPVYSSSGMFSPYTYERYGLMDGFGPGNGTWTTLLDVRYSHEFGNLSLMASASYDTKHTQQYQIMGDTIPDLQGYDIVYPNGTEVPVRMATGGFQTVRFQESSYNVKLQMNYRYAVGRHNGNILLGVHYYHFSLDDSQYLEGDQYDRVLRVYNDTKQLYTGHENTADAYLQFKHVWRDHFILNAGMRYDYKHRLTRLSVTTDERGTSDVNVFSPRVAMIVNYPHWNAKLSYAKSFVDAPYYYRNNSLDIGYGLNLDPEYLKSLQLTLSGKDFVPGLHLEVNGFYNKLENYIYYYPPLGLFINGGSYKNLGAELIARYGYRTLSVTGNLTLQHMLESENLATVDDKVCNVPTVQTNLVLAYQPLKGLNVHANASYSSKQISETPLGSEEIPSNVLVGLGANYVYRNLTMSFDVHNLLNRTYSLGGSVTAPIRQQGLWLMGSVGYKFGK